MKKLSVLLLTLFVTTTALQAQDNVEVSRIDQRTQTDFVPGQVLVKFKDGNPVRVSRVKGKFKAADRSGVNNVLQQFGVTEMDKLFPKEQPNRQLRRARAYNGGYVAEQNMSQLYFMKMKNLRPDSVELLVKALEQLPEVEYAEPNYKFYLMDARIAETYDSNPLCADQWYLSAYGVTQLWNKPIVNAERPVIAIIDTGVDLTHPDLVDNLWTNTVEAEGEAGYDNDNNGFAGDIHGWDFVNDTPNIRDNNMHGTHVAGIAAAANNNIGIVGANPQALIMPVSVMQSDGTGDVATIVKGIDYAVQNGATVLNLSLGSYANSQVMRQALEQAYQKAVIVAAAGNDGLCINRKHEHKPDPMPAFPAAYSFVLGVQALNSDGTLAGFSNYDDDGPNYSGEATVADPDGFNYELKAPGTNMMSTVPGGNYKALQGTSMAAPLVAGSISALMMVKNYDSQEILWGDLIHSNNIAGAFDVTERPSELDLLNIQMRDRKELADETEADYSDDNRVDVGETISIYPVIRTTFGEAGNIKLHLEMGDNEDPSVVEILNGEDNKADFGLHLDAYGKGVSQNPLQLKVADNLANGRIVKLKIVAACDNTDQEFKFDLKLRVDNMVKLSGMITSDMTLTPDHEYFVTSSLAIPEGVTFTIKPGTVVNFASGIGVSNAGTFIAEGEPGNMITLKCEDSGDYWNGISGVTLKYCIVKDIIASVPTNTRKESYENCILDHCHFYSLLDNRSMKWTNVINSYISESWQYKYKGSYGAYDIYNEYCNIINNVNEEKGNWANSYKCYDIGTTCNWIHSLSANKYSLGYYATETKYIKPDAMPYYGTSREDILRSQIYEMGNHENFRQETFSYYDLTNMNKTPNAEAHGIVWKVVVNGKDAQDEYEDLAPLGVGRHKFEVYFNRPMNKAVAPNVSFGVREPYTQQAVAEDGEWNEEGTVYTVYKTIDGKTKSDGVNRIYVYGAQDDEYFEVPVEKYRFNINVQAAGSMATGFAGEGMMGRVELTWNNAENNFDDAMGFNIYRYHEVERMMPVLDDWGNEIWEDDEEGNYVRKEELRTVTDTIRLNTEILDIETTEYTDYDVTPGVTYYYYYKVLSTDLQEFDASNIVAVTPLTATRGDANGSGEVNVADVVTTVSKAIGEKPQPFIFEAADVNSDQQIDVLDVVGIIDIILTPEAARTMAMGEALYGIDNGQLWVESNVPVAGLQVQLSTSQTPQGTEALEGFELMNTWLSENDCLTLSFSMTGKTVAPGRQTLLSVGDAQVVSLRLSDRQGHDIRVTAAEGTTAVDRMGAEVMSAKGIYNMSGQKMDSTMEQLHKGVYIMNGVKVVK